MSAFACTVDMKSEVIMCRVKIFTVEPAGFKNNIRINKVYVKYHEAQPFRRVLTSGLYPLPISSEE